MQITVEIEEPKLLGVSQSQAVADYVRSLFKVRALKRAVTEAVLENEQRRQRLTGSQLNEALRLFYEHRAVGEARREP
jgi:hypothetical protein